MRRNAYLNLHKLKVNPAAHPERKGGCQLLQAPPELACAKAMRVCREYAYDGGTGMGRDVWQLRVWPQSSAARPEPEAPEEQLRVSTFVNGWITTKDCDLGWGFAPR